MTTINTILITGANRGIGLGLTQHYVSLGFQVYATCREQATAKDLMTLAKASQNLSVLTCDVANEDSVNSLAQSLKSVQLDVFINNAGVYGPKGEHFGDVNAESWQDVLNVNTIAPLMLTQALHPNLKHSQLSKVALISSKMGSVTDNSYGRSYVYRSSKAALNAVGKSLAIDLATDNIAVTILHPGWVQTDMGGPDALISVDESVKGMTKIIEQLDEENTGKFFAFDGAEIPW